MNKDDEIEQYRQLASILFQAVRFYADPETYHAIGMIADPPAGAFAQDSDREHGNEMYDCEMPGKMARAAIREAMEKYSDLSIYEVDWQEEEEEEEQKAPLGT